MSSGKCKLKLQWDTTTHLLEWTKSRTPTTSNVDQDVGQQKLSCIAGNAKWYSHFGRQFGNVLQKLTYSSFPIIIPPWYLPKELKFYVHTKICTQMFLTTLFIITKTWKQSRYSLVGEWLNELWSSRQWNIIRTKKEMSFPGTSAVKNLPAMQETQETWTRSLGQNDPLEQSMATPSSILAWTFSWTEKPGGL